MKKVYLSLGSNCGNKKENIDCAINDIGKIYNVHIKSVSSKYLTEPFGTDTDSWFVNCAVEIETIIDPVTLLNELSSIEKRYGREWERETGYDRTIDIDILLYGDDIIAGKTLNVPHPELCKRRFVLVSLSEIAPEIIHPIERKTISCLLDECKDSKRVVQE